MSARPRSRAAAVAAGLIYAILIAGCSGTAASPSPVPSPTRAPATFSVTIGAPISATWHSVPSAVNDTCRTPSAGAWSYTYTAAAVGDQPALDIQLSLPDGAATTAASGRFRLDLSPGESAGLPVWMVDPKDLLSESHGTTGTVTVSVTPDGARVHLEGMALARGTDDPKVLPPAGGFQPIVLDLACPA